MTRAASKRLRPSHDAASSTSPAGSPTSRSATPLLAAEDAVHSQRELQRAVNARVQALFWRGEMILADAEGKAAQLRYKYAKRKYDTARDEISSSEEGDEPPPKRAKTGKGKARAPGKEEFKM